MFLVFFVLDNSMTPPARAESKRSFDDATHAVYFRANEFLSGLGNVTVSYCEHEQIELSDKHQPPGDLKTQRGGKRRSTPLRNASAALSPPNTCTEGPYHHAPSTRDLFVGLCQSQFWG